MELNLFGKEKNLSFKRKIHHYTTHETKKASVVKFVILIVILLIYFGIVSLKYGLNNGIITTILTWSFFVFCTPIADAGFIVGFPVRFLFNVKMLYSEIAVTIVATAITFLALIYSPASFSITGILLLYKYILFHPLYWLIIILSTAGTFLSIYFGDELIDVVKHEDRKKYKKHKNKHTIIITLFLFVFTFLFYLYIIQNLNVNISLW